MRTGSRKALPNLQIWLLLPNAWAKSKEIATAPQTQKQAAKHDAKKLLDNKTDPPTSNITYVSQNVLAKARDNEDKLHMKLTMANYVY